MDKQRTYYNISVVMKYVPISSFAGVLKTLHIEYIYYLWTNFFLLSNHGKYSKIKTEPPVIFNCPSEVSCLQWGRYESFSFFITAPAPVSAPTVKKKLHCDILACHRASAAISVELAFFSAPLIINIDWHHEL